MKYVLSSCASVLQPRVIRLNPISEAPYRGYQVSGSLCWYTRGETVRLMAAIIAQITRAKRERDRRVREAALKDCKERLQI